MQIKLKNSVTQDSTPSASDLPDVGELAVNGNINSIGGFMRASDNSIVKIFGPGSVTTPTATTTVSGISELATNAETTTGTATNRVVTPAGLNAVTVAERTTSNSTYLAKAGGTLTGVVAATAGSNSAPSIHFGDSDSGIFGGTNTVSLAAGGTTRLTADTGVSVVGTLAVTGAITSTSDLTIADKIIHAGDTNTAIRFPAADTVSVETNASEALRVDSSQRLLVGASSSRAVASNTARLLQIEATSGASGIALTRNSANNGNAFLSFGKSRSASNGGVTIVQNNDVLGEITFAGADGTDIKSVAARIFAQVDGTPGSDDMPGRLVFGTTADGADSPTTRLTIDSAGTSTFTGNITTTGTISSGNINITSVAPIITLTDTNANDDFEIKVNGGLFEINDITNSANRFIINSDGTVDVLGNLDVGAGLDVTGAITGTGDLTIDTNTLHVDSSNNRVGIGTTSPVGRFHVHNAGTGSGDHAYAYFTTGDTGASVSDGLTIGVNATATAVVNFREAGGLTFGTSNTERMRIDSSGNVGIGTTSPSALLSLKGSQNSTLLHINDSSEVGHRQFTIASSDNGLTYTLNSQGSSGGISGEIAFACQGSEKMRIQEDGKVGIGLIPNTSDVATNVSPGLFQTDGNIDIRYSGTNSDPAGARYLNFINTDTTLVQGQPMGGIHWIGNDTSNLNRITAAITAECTGNSGTASSLLFKTDTAEHMRINGSGLVGIGTTSPSTQLTVRNATQACIVRVTAKNDEEAGIDFGDDDDVDIGRIRYSNSADAMKFIVNAAECMRITSTARLGIGTTNPQKTLHAVSSENSVARIETTAATGRLEFKASGTTTIPYIEWNANDLMLETGGTERLRIKNDGRIAIGSDATPNGAAAITSNYLQAATGQSMIAIVSNQTAHPSDTNNIAALARSISGSVTRQCYIGTRKVSTNNPAGFLYIQQRDGGNSHIWADNNAKIRTSNDFNQIGAASGTIVGTQTSDIRLKNNLGSVSYGLTEINKITPIKYTFKKDETSRQQIGFSAQDIQSIIPESVYDTEETVEVEGTEIKNTLAMEYVSLIPVLVNAIKELSTKVAALEAA